MNEKIKQIKERLEERIRTDDTYIKSIDEMHEKTLDKIEEALENYRNHLRPWARKEMWIGFDLAGSAANSFKKAMYNLGEELRNITRDSMRKPGPERIMGPFEIRIHKNLCKTFGTSDEENRINYCLDISKDKLYKILEYPPTLRILAEPLSNKEREAIINREMNKKTYEEIISRLIQSIQRHNYNSKEFELLKEAKKELSNTPYSLIQDPINKRNEIKEITEKEWEDYKEKSFK